MPENYVETPDRSGLKFRTWNWKKPDNFVMEAGRLLAMADRGLLPYSAWDLPIHEEESRKARFVAALAAAPLVMAALTEKYAPIALAWARQHNKFCAELHFMSLARRPALIKEAGKLFVNEAACRWPSLFGLIPKAFIGARRLAVDLGFTEAGVIPMACALASLGRVMDGVIYTRAER